MTRVVVHDLGPGVIYGYAEDARSGKTLLVVNTDARLAEMPTPVNLAEILWADL